MENNENIIAVTNLYSVTNEDIDDIMCAALEGGVNYWCSKVEVVDEYLGEYAHEQISREGELIFYDAEDDSEYVLTKSMLLNGVKLAIKHHCYAQYNWYTDEHSLDCCQIDAAVADCIVQYALFSEIVYC